MNPQIRRLFLVVLAIFAALALALTNIQFLQAPALNADSRNSRSILRAASLDRGPIIVAGEAVASSQRIPETQRYQRTYPQGPLYAHVTGYFSVGNSQATGLESAEEDVLDGDSHTLLAQRLRNLFTGQHRQGGGVVLTIDPELQQVATSALGNRKGAVVALDARTGAILALQSTPTFDPNPLASFDTVSANEAYEALVADPSAPLDNRAIAGTRYAPGSTFKILSSILLLEKGIATPDTEMDSPAETTLPGTSTQLPNFAHNACGNGHPTLTEAFARSCNTTFAIASQKLTTADYLDLTSRFGFGEELHVPLAVTPSYFPEKADAAQLALSSIGQYTVQVTPMQMAMVAQAIANGGTLMRPYLVEQVVDADMQVQTTTVPEKMGTPITAEIAAELTRMMRAVVEQPYGTARYGALPNIAVAAKTGTAELGDGSGISNSLAVGFAPADDPRIAFAVLVQGSEEVPMPEGSEGAIAVARALLEAGLQ